MLIRSTSRNFSIELEEQKENSFSVASQLRTEFSFCKETYMGVYERVVVEAPKEIEPKWVVTVTTNTEGEMKISFVYVSNKASIY